jgi:hypothetical protein
LALRVGENACAKCLVDHGASLDLTDSDVSTETSIIFFNQNDIHTQCCVSVWAGQLRAAFGLLL